MELKMQLDNKNMKEFFKKLVNSCRTGDVEFIKEIIGSDLVKRINDPVPGKMLMESSASGNMEIIQALYDSPVLKKHIHKHDFVRDSVIRAFECGQVEVSKFLLKKLDSLNGYHDGVIFTGILNAMAKGKINIIKNYLEDSSIRVDKEKLIQKTLDQSCFYDQLDIAKYIIQTTNIQESKDFSQMMDSMFLTCLKHKSYDVLRYFVFDLNIAKTPFIDSALFMVKDNNSSNVSNWFNIRELGQSLETELNQIATNSTNKKMKV